MKRKEYLLLIPVFLFLVLTGCIGLNPLEKGSLQGTVNGGDGPLPGVKVEVGEMVALTDVSGHFLLENVPAGDQYVFFSGSGYASAFQKVTIIKDGRVSLSPEGTISLLPGTDENVRDSIFSLYQYGFYERSKEESDSFLTRFPTSSFYSDVLFIKGASFFYLGEYADSIPFLSSLVNGYPESLFADDGQYLLAKSYGQGQSRWGEAITAYRKLVDNYPQSEFVGPSYAEMGDCYYIMESYQDAKVVYELARPFGGDVERKSIYGLAHCYYKSELYYKSATLFAEYVTRYPDNDLADDAQYF
ncbi:MAG: tetratricopeptide repeat protein, partial [Atribacterota bacterium]